MVGGQFGQGCFEKLLQLPSQLRGLTFPRVVVTVGRERDLVSCAQDRRGGNARQFWWADVVNLNQCGTVWSQVLQTERLQGSGGVHHAAALAERLSRGWS